MTKRKPKQIYPDARVREIIGDSAPLYHQALSCWAHLMAEASSKVADLFSKDDWCYLADVLNGTLHEPNSSEPGAMLAASVEDGARLDGLGEKWYGAKHATTGVRELSRKLAQLSYPEAWAVITAVQWFWDHCYETVPDQWWTIAARRRHAQVDQN